MWWLGCCCGVEVRCGKGVCICSGFLIVVWDRVCVLLFWWLICVLYVFWWLVC